MKVVKQRRNHMKHGNKKKKFFIIFSHQQGLVSCSTFMLCTIALLSVSMHDTMLAFLLIPKSTNYSI